MNNADNFSDEPFSEDPIENLKIENELLRLKMQVKSGAHFSGTEDLDPTIENEFLKHIQQFETAWQDAKSEKIYDLLGQPAFIKADNLQPEEVAAELQKLEALLETHNIALDVLGQYEPLIIYRFITEELFEHQTDGMHLPGMTTHYIYEEFHPNHELDIRSHTERFMNDWFTQQFNEHSFELASSFALPDGSELPKKDVLQKLHYLFDAYPRFFNDRFTIEEVRFQWNNDLGMGHAEGMVSYNAEAENGDITTLEGPYKLYMSNEYGSWQIFYFVMPGFNWQ